MYLRLELLHLLLGQAGLRRTPRRQEHLHLLLQVRGRLHLRGQRGVTEVCFHLKEKKLKRQKADERPVTSPCEEAVEPDDVRTRQSRLEAG